MKTIAERIKFEREKRNMTQKQFALILDIKQGHYSRMESGLLRITSDQMLILHEKLGIDLHYLITGKYVKFNYNLDKMDLPELKNLNNEIFEEMEKRLNISKNG